MKLPALAFILWQTVFAAPALSQAILLESDDQSIPVSFHPGDIIGLIDGLDCAAETVCNDNGSCEASDLTFRLVGFHFMSADGGRTHTFVRLPELTEESFVEMGSSQAEVLKEGHAFMWTIDDAKYTLSVLSNLRFGLLSSLLKSDGPFEVDVIYSHFGTCK